MEHRLVNVMQLISSLEVGGAEKLLVDLLAACRDDDRINFTVVVMNRSINLDMQERLERLGLNVYYLNRPESHRHPKYLLELLRIIHRHQIQIVHAHNFGSKLWAVLCKLVFPKIKLVFTVHDTMMMPRLNQLQIWIHQCLIHTNIAISKTVAELCRNRQVLNYHQIYNGIDLKLYAVPDKPTLIQRVAESPFGIEPLRILYVGRMDYPVKGQDILVQAIRLCKQSGLNVQCTLMGGVYAYNQKSFSELQQMVHELGLDKEITFLLNRTDVSEVLSKAELFVLPSRFEGLGLVLLEAMAAGVPVIASNTDGPQELIEEGVNGFLFEKGQPEHLFKKIRFVYENPDVAEQVRRHALNFVQDFDIHVMKRQYYKLYESLMQDYSARYAWQNNPAFRRKLGRLTNETGL
jgi:glycosyltransferase involved in cell wall biosynthesis